MATGLPRVLRSLKIKMNGEGDRVAIFKSLQLSDHKRFSRLNIGLYPVILLYYIPKS